MIIEFSGIPRSGKTTSLEANANYFIRKGYTVTTRADNAASCPFSHQHRIPTAFWIAHRVINDVIQFSINDPSGTLVFQDRGLFDAMAFLKLLDLEKSVNSEDRAPERISSDGIHRFLRYASYWTRVVDLVILFDIEPSIAVTRDLAARMTSGPGMITNPETMTALGKAYAAIIEEYGNSFPRIERLITTEDDPLTTALKVRNIILKTLQEHK